jgi:hypothetical protein
MLDTAASPASTAASSAVASSVVASAASSVLPSLATSTNRSADDPVSAPLREVLAVFDDVLDDVRFPDVDGAALHTATDVVNAAHLELRRLEAAVDEARRRLDEAQESLLHKAQRAVAYARVYADGDTTLTARLDAIALPRSRGPRPATPEPTRKRRRNASATESLFAAPAGDDVVDDEARAAQ